MSALNSAKRLSTPMVFHGRFSVDWSGQPVRPEVITQQDGSRGGYRDSLHMIDILFGLDPEKRPSDGTIYTPDGYPESVSVRIDRADALRLYERLQIALGLTPAQRVIPMPNVNASPSSMPTSLDVTGTSGGKASTEVKR